MIKQEMLLTARFVAGSVFLTNSLAFQTPVIDLNNQLLAPGGKGTWGSWGKGSSGGTSTKPADSGRFPRINKYM